MPAGVRNFCAAFMASRDFYGRDGAEALDNYIPEGDIKRSPSDKAFEKFALSKLMSLEPDPEVSSAFGKLAALADLDFDSKAVRSDPAAFAKLREAVAAVGKLTTHTTRHYQCWRRVFAVFQSKLLNKQGTLASPERQEDLRGVNSDAVLDYIQNTTEHFVQARVDGEAPPMPKSMPPYKSALSVQQDILLLFWRGFVMGVTWIMTDEVEDLMTDVQPSQLAAVPKKNPAALLFTGDGVSSTTTTRAAATPPTTVPSAPPEVGTRRRSALSTTRWRY